MFTWLLNFSLTNRIIVLLLSLIMIVYGAFTLKQSSVDVFPDLNKPTVTVMTEAGGMASEEVEQLITFPLETVMNGLPGVESVRSVSSAGLSSSISLLTGRPIYIWRGSLSENVLDRWKVPYLLGWFRVWVQLAQSWVKSCRLPYLSRRKKFLQCR